MHAASPPPRTCGMPPPAASSSACTRRAPGPPSNHLASCAYAAEAALCAESWCGGAPAGPAAGAALALAAVNGREHSTCE
eukprot:110945-Chlamydomonas_euryale.AAC.1